MKLMETSKMKGGEKYWLAFHPSRVYQELQEMGGVSLKDLKEHANAVGGCWGNDTWANLVRDDVDVDFEHSDTEDGAGLENTQSKRAVLIPVSVFSSTQIICRCDLLGQNDDYKRFGADEETPSGVEEFSNYRNSTQMPGSQGLRLHVSSIQEVEEEDNVFFDNLSRPEDFDDDDDDDAEDDEGEEQLEPNHGIEVDEGGPDINSEELNSCSECNETFNTRGELSTHVKSTHRVKDKKTQQSSRYITEVSRNNKAYFVCTCGFSSLQKSASSRHKCRNGDQVIFHCLDCNKPCNNPGSLKRHMNSKHKNQTATQLSQAGGSSNTSSWPEPDLAQFSSVSLSDSRKTCRICNKTLLNEKNLRKHLERVHAGHAISGEESAANSQSTEDVVESNTSSQVTTQSSQGEGRKRCELCSKTYLNDANLKKHLQKVHMKDVEPTNSSTSFTNEVRRTRSTSQSTRRC